MITELDILRDVGERLERGRIPFMLTGSLALAYYAQPRMTRDIDLVIQVGRTDAAALAALFAPDYHVSEEDVARALRTEGMFNVLHLESVIKVDLVIRKSEAFRETEFERRRWVDLAGVATWIVSKEDLILSKLVWARDSHSELQLRDVRALVATGADMEYVRRWARMLGVHDLLEEVSR